MNFKTLQQQHMQNSSLVKHPWNLVSREKGERAREEKEEERVRGDS
jgi:hypothetical protein